MPVHSSKSTWSVETARQLFNVSRWSEGYFDIRGDGRVVCRPNGEGGTEIALSELIEAIVAEGLNLPVLVRFQDILTDRVKKLCEAFDHAAGSVNYNGRHTVVYPIKVNQQRSVVEQLARAVPGRVGLEAGSKPELMAVLAQTFYKSGADDHETLICNGYKDREYIRLALIGGELGKRVFIVVEKPDELDLVLRQAQDLGVTPRLGVRVRLASVAKGRWQNSGGEKSKFGLSSAQVLALVEKLRAQGQLHCLQLLHFHMGSQIADLEDIRASVREAARSYQELRELGAAVEVIDVGGGVGVDYDGTASTREFSMNYRVQSYADTVLSTVAEACGLANLPHPEVITESGRAVTAHHAVLITNVVDIERVDSLYSPDFDANEYSQGMQALITQAAAQQDAVAVGELLPACDKLLQDAQRAYSRGELGLHQRAAVEQLAVQAYIRLHSRLTELDKSHPALARLNEKLADKFFCNISVFQSLPDVWGIGQLFPIMPLTGLNEPLTARAVLHDLTCDSDGQIEAYAAAGSIHTTLPVHKVEPGQKYFLGFFLVGAYQEILGDMHNLFGDTNSINVVVEDNGYRLEDLEPGDRIDELLNYVHYSPPRLLTQYKRKLERTRLSEAAKQQYYLELAAGLSGYSYLED
ncbi:MAG TPA: biosynthetic arginine decarboxylase [Gammaproteobacteria bacterium]